MSEESSLTSIVPPQPLEEGRLGTIRAWAGLIRDLGVIIGIPALIGVGMQLYDIQEKATEAQIKASEAQVKVVEAQNAALKDTQYDKALALLNSQKELFDKERTALQKKNDEDKAEISSEINRLRVSERECLMKVVGMLSSKLVNVTTPNALTPDEYFKILIDTASSICS